MELLITRKKMHVRLLIFMIFSAMVADAVPEIKITVDKPDYFYKTGEETIFTICIRENNQILKNGKVFVRLSNDGGNLLQNKTIELSETGNPFQVSGKLETPSFLRLSVLFLEKLEWSAVAYEPEKIITATALPDDFEKFWKDGIEGLKKIPPDVKLIPLPQYSNKNYDCWIISFANIENSRIYGFLSVPKGRPGPYPAMVSFLGAGPGFYLPNENEVNAGFIVLRLNVHAYEPPVTREKWIEKASELQKRKPPYFLQGMESRDTYFYRAAILGINRGIDYLAARKDFDGKSMIAEGQSQGGAMALIAAALNKNITSVIADVPAFCDLNAKAVGRTPGFPAIYKLADGREDVLKYYDVVNFCRFIKVPVLMSAGFIDLSCAPGSVYAAYNTLNVPKIIFPEPGMMHTHSPLLNRYKAKWMLDHCSGNPVMAPLKK